MSEAVFALREAGEGESDIHVSNPKSRGNNSIH